MGGTLRVPFLLDVDAHARFLIALPLLIYAEWIVHERMRPVIRSFLDRKLVPEDSMNKLDSAMKSAFRLRNSIVAEILLIALVYGVGVLIIWRSVSLKTATWYSSGEGGLPSREIGMAMSVYLCSSSCSFDGIFVCSSGRGFSGRFHGSGSS